MPFTDDFLRVSEAQAIINDGVSTNSIPIGVARDLAAGTDLFAHIIPTTSVSGGTATTVNFQIIGASDAALTTAIEVLGESGDIAVANLAKTTEDGSPGKNPIVVDFRTKLGAATSTTAYIGIRYLFDAAAGAGAFTADFTINPGDSKKYYASGFTLG